MKPIKPMVSVVIAAYNCAGWIEEVIQDVLGQSYSNLELIVIDDGSKDATGKVVQSIQDPRLRYVWQEGSGSPAKPRNHGLSLARGEYISFLDHDDRWSSDRMQKVIGLFESNHELDVVCHDQWVVCDRKRLRKNRYGPASRQLYLDMLLKGNRLATSAVTLKTARARGLRGFNEDRDLFTVEDFDLWLRLAKDGCKFHFLHEVLGEYTIHASNMTANRVAHHEAKRALAVRHIRENFELLGSHESRILAHCDLAIARDLHSRRDFKAAISKYRDAWKGGCRSFKLYSGGMLAVLKVKV